MQDSPSTFNPALASPRDHLRVELGDIDTSKAIFEDATYDGMLASYSFHEATIRLCESAGLIFAQKADETDEPGEIRVSYKKRADWFMEKAKILRKVAEEPPAQSISPMQSGAFVGVLPYTKCGYKPF